MHVAISHLSPFTTRPFNYRDAMRYCFGSLIQKQLTDLVTEWNHHHIRKTATAEAPGGIPEVLYFLPGKYGI